ncbi:Uncharacterized protein TCM_004764 [Theobroma cacao]|uniref:Uncharacterized protein n=1 Tax=Theobroma cacao TaxID=3641 RepID=A0A061DZ02_THECC|nr:Uncharacterized protein TCM_004764 [Theobroma cacao]
MNLWNRASFLKALSKKQNKNQTRDNKLKKNSKWAITLYFDVPNPTKPSQWKRLQLPLFVGLNTFWKQYFYYYLLNLLHNFMVAF